MLRNLKYLLPSFRREEERDMREELDALAEIAGRKELGNLTLAAENARAALGWNWIDALAADARYACRGLKRQPGFFAVAVISLGLGIGANAAIFSLIDTLLLRQLPVHDPDRLVHFDMDSCSYFSFDQFRSKSGGVLAGLIATTSLDRNIDGNNGHIEFVSGNYFDVLGVNARLGRPLTTDDDRFGQPAPVAVVSYNLWRRILGADSGAIGRAIRIEKTPFTVVGVAPPDFFGVTVGEAPDVWLPLNAYPLVLSGENPLTSARYNFLGLVGRLRPGITIERAAAALTPLAVQIDLQRAGPDLPNWARKEMEKETVRLEPASKGISYLRARYSKPLQIIFAMVAAGLLLACLNVTSLQLARADERRLELTVRLAIGASRWRIVRQLLTESALVALAGAALGLAICRPSARALASLTSAGAAQLDVRVNWAVLLFVLAVSAVAALLCGLAPALRATGRELSAGLQQGVRSATASRPRRSVARLIVTAQMALSVVLIGGAFLFAFSLYKLTHFDTGVNRQRLLVVEVDSSDAGYKGAAAGDLNRRLLARLRAIRAVEAASFSWAGIYSGRNFSDQVEADGFHPVNRAAKKAVFDQVGPGFVAAVGARLLAGRDFTERDDASAAKVTIVSRQFAQHFFPEGDAIGRNIYLTRPNGKLTYQVVGIMADLWYDARHQPKRWFYVPHLQYGAEVGGSRFLIRTAGASPASIRSAIRAENPDLRIVSMDDADQLLYRTMDTDRLIAALSLAFGVLALALAGVGIYGLLARDVARRTAEIGIRLALGATGPGVIAMVFREVAVVAAAGLAIGTASAFWLSDLVRKLVFDIKPGDPRILPAAALLLAAVAASAAWLPARRAASMDPMRALRTD